MRRLPVSLVLSISTQHPERVGHAPTPQPRRIHNVHGGHSLRRLDAATKDRKGESTMTQLLYLLTAEEAGTIATAIPAATDPELGEPRCPNGHDSSVPPKCPALMFVTCWHYSTQATWNEHCITCGVRHAPFRIYWRSYLMDDRCVQAKHYCGYCGAKMISGRASR